MAFKKEYGRHTVIHIAAIKVGSCAGAHVSKVCRAQQLEVLTNLLH